MKILDAKTKARFVASAMYIASQNIEIKNEFPTAYWVPGAIAWYIDTDKSDNKFNDGISKLQNTEFHGIIRYCMENDETEGSYNGIIKCVKTYLNI